MPGNMQNLIKQYVNEIKQIYGTHLRQIILYGSYARGDFRPDSDIDIMILLDLSDLELKAYSQKLSYMTYDFNMDYNIDIKPIAKSEAHFNKWIVNYPFYSNIHRRSHFIWSSISKYRQIHENIWRCHNLFQYSNLLNLSIQCIS